MSLANSDIQREVSGSSLARVGSRLGGFNPPQEPVNREELVRQGASHQQVDAVEVQRHQNELLQGYLRKWLMSMMCLLCIILPLSLGFFIWLVLAWTTARQGETRCDSPLIEWTSVLYGVKMYYLFAHSCVIRLVCGYEPNQEPRPPPPRKVVIYNILLSFFDFAWSITGIFLAASSNDCGEKLPSLYKAVLAFACTSTFMILFILVNTIGIQAIAAYMLRNGLLTGQQAAKSGTYEQQKVVQIGSAELGDVTQCAICLDDFDADPSKEIRQTNCSGKHAFHATCLKGWLKVGRTCPLCRQDLTEGEPSQDTATIGRFGDVV